MSAPITRDWRYSFLYIGVTIALVLFGFGMYAYAAGSGALRWNGVWAGNGFSCDAGYTLRSYHYDCGCSNNATWYACVPQ